MLSLSEWDLFGLNIWWKYCQPNIVKFNPYSILEIHFESKLKFSKFCDFKFVWHYLKFYPANGFVYISWCFRLLMFLTLDVVGCWCFRAKSWSFHSRCFWSWCFGTGIYGVTWIYSMKNWKNTAINSVCKVWHIGHLFLILQDRWIVDVWKW